MKAPWLKKPKPSEPETVRIKADESPKPPQPRPILEQMADWPDKNSTPHAYMGPSDAERIAGLKRENELNLDAIRGLTAENKGLHGKLAIAIRDLEEAQKELNSREVEIAALRRTLEFDERVFARLCIPKPKGKRR